MRPSLHRGSFQANHRRSLFYRQLEVRTAHRQLGRGVPRREHVCGQTVTGEHPRNCVSVRLGRDGQYPANAQTFQSAQAIGLRSRSLREPYLRGLDATLIGEARGSAPRTRHEHRNGHRHARYPGTARAKLASDFTLFVEMPRRCPEPATSHEDLLQRLLGPVFATSRRRNRTQPARIRFMLF